MGARGGPQCAPRAPAETKRLAGTRVMSVTSLPTPEPETGRGFLPFHADPDVQRTLAPFKLRRACDSFTADAANLQIV